MDEKGYQGLSSREVEERVRNGMVNTPVEAPSKTVKEIVLSNILTYFNFIFAGIATLLILVGAFRELTFLPVIILNTCIGIIQELRSKSVLDKLSVLNAPRARVIRDGVEKTVRAEELVLDDLVVFTAGNQIPADAVVVGGEAQVNESLITGESDEITKNTGKELLSGSFVVSGKCYAKLTRVGADSYASKLTLEAKEVKEGEQSEMIRSLNKLVKAVGILIIPVGIVLFYQQFFLGGNSLRGSVVSMTAAVIGMIPEGLYLLASVALVVSVMKLAKQKVLVHDMKCIETLARVDVLCVDKTGTITETDMKVNKVIALTDDEPLLSEKLADFVFNMSCDNSTMEALQKYFRNMKGQGKKAEKIVSFSSAYKYSCAVIEDTTYILGAPEVVLRDQFEEYEEKIEKQSKKGYRVLVFAVYNGETEGKELTEEVHPLAIVTLSNPIRRNARETFRYFANQGVEIKVISGDNPVTASKVAVEAGIENGDKYIDARTLKTEAELAKAAQEYTVFGRVTPKQKRMFVNALKRAGRTVAMTGDGVNDVLALKDADCSVAMASGSDVASQASQLVLLESDFSRMPSVVGEGRQVVNNIERSASLFLVKNIFSFLLAAISMAFAITYPLRPAQISFVAMFTIGTPAFLLAMEPNKKIIKGHFLTNVFLKALPAGLTDVVMVGMLVIYGEVFGVSQEEISVTATLLLAIVGLQILMQLSKPMNVFRWIVWGGMSAGLLLSAIFMGGWFGIEEVTIKSILLLIVFAIATLPVFTQLCRIVEKLEIYFEQHRMKSRRVQRRKGK